MECIEDILCENGVKKLLTVPCTILNKYFYKNTIETIYLSKEEEGVGIASGLTIAKEKPVMIIQNSGLGNCINAFASLCNPYKIGFLVIVSMRGDELEDNPVQIPMGNATKTLISSLDCEYYTFNKEEQFSTTIQKGLNKIQETNKPVFILLPRKDHFNK